MTASGGLSAFPKTRAPAKEVRGRHESGRHNWTPDVQAFVALRSDGQLVTWGNPLHGGVAWHSPRAAVAKSLWSKIDFDGPWVMWVFTCFFTINRRSGSNYN